MQHTRPLLNKKRLFSNMSDEISNRNRNGNENRNGNNKQKKNSLFGGMTSNQDYASVIANRLLERNDHGGVDADKKPIQPPSILSKFVLKMTEELLGNNPDLVLTPEIDLEDYVELGSKLADIALAVMKGAVISKIKTDKELKNG